MRRVLVECLGLQAQESRETMKQKAFSHPKPLPVDCNSEQVTDSDGAADAAGGVEDEPRFNVVSGKSTEKPKKKKKKEEAKTAAAELRAKAKEEAIAAEGAAKIELVMHAEME